MLKLIVNNTAPLDKKGLPQGLLADPTILNTAAQNSFLVDFQEISSNLYEFRTKDLNHELTCEITLELKESFVDSSEEGDEGYLASVVTGHFPSISMERFNEKICWDSYLQGIIMIQFQLKVLEQLLLFCEEKNAINLILTINDVDLDYLEIYRRFFISEDQILTERGEQTEIIIPTDVETYDALIDFMDEINGTFCKTLWSEKTLNPTFRKYLKENAMSLL